MDLSDLLNVGPNKPMGYLPIDSMIKFGYNIDDVATQLEDLGLSIAEYGFRTTSRNPNRYAGQVESLYAWDRVALQKLIDQHKNTMILWKSDWPHDADDFVHQVATEHVFREENPDLYALIGRAFADKRFQTSECLLRKIIREELIQSLKQ